MSKKIKDMFHYLKCAKEYELEYIQINYDRLIPVAIIMYLFEWVIFLLSKLYFNIGQIVLIYQIYSTVLLPFIFYAYKHITSISRFKLKFISYMYLVGLIIFGAFLVYTTRSHTDLLHIFLMMVLTAGALFYIPPKESLLIIVLPSILFIFGLVFFNYNADHIRVFATNTLIFIFIVYILSANLFILKIKDLHLQKELSLANDRLEQMTKIDQMTGLYTHTAIRNILSEEVERAKRYCKPLSIVLIDIDNFKDLNDRQGHLFGDTVIKELSVFIKNNIRANDYAGRYGGDEFVIILPSADISGAENLYHRTCDALHDCKLLHSEKVTISAGIALYQYQSVNDFINVADNCLYAAKRSGKARYISNALDVIKSGLSDG